ncbi:MAG: beta-galactosidase trimerization domain-containing protein [Clostridia bacterium]|nr:beta-galactosidase trimerization domain-containing protein [Clostridia bacterium]
MNQKLKNAMRYAQLTICEGDIGKFDPDRWLSWLDECFCDGLVLGSGGYIAYHETDIPYHYRVKDEKHEDLFGYMVDACRRKGYAVICRTDSHAIHEDAFRAHPEWAAVTADGKPRRHWSYPEAYVSCPLGPYGFDFMKRVHGELAARYDMDGIFCNRWPGSGVCYCASCRKSFYEFSGKEIPLVMDPADETVKLYRKWHEKRAFELCECWDEEIRKNNPNMRFIPNSSVGTDPFIDNKVLGDYAEVLYADYQGRGGLMTPWFNGRTAKQLHAVLQGKPVGGIFSTGTTEKRWKDSVQEPAELEMWISEAVANGLRPWFTKFSVQVFDERWMPAVRNLYRKYHGWERYLKDTGSAAEAALVFSQQTVKEYAGREREKLVEKPINGWYHALLEARIPFDMLDSHYIDPAHLSRYKAVILPNIAVLSDEDCAALKEYAEEGGAVVADFETSLYDKDGKKREDFGLADLFGVHANGSMTRDELNAYIRVLPDAGDHLMREGFFEGEKEGWCEERRLCGTENRVGITWDPSGFEESPFRAVPAFPDLPMEEVYPRDIPADYEEVFFRKVGKGRAVYFPGDIGRCYWDYLLPDWKRLMADSVRWALAGDDTVRVKSSGLIDVTLWRNGEGLMVHLVNLTSVHTMRGPAEEILPLSEIEVSVRNDLAGEGSVLSLENEGITVEKGERYTTVKLPSLKIHEVLIFR